jgi:hypothetical protein
LNNLFIYYLVFHEPSDVSTKNSIRDFLQLPTITWRDRVLLYFSGHGYKEIRNGRYRHYIQLSDNTKIYTDELLRWAHACRGHVILITDCCFSDLLGNVARGPNFRTNVTPPTQQNLTHYLTNPAKMGISASSANTVAYESGNGGMFTQSLIDVLQNDETYGQVQWATVYRVGNAVQDALASGQDVYLTDQH